MTVAISRANSLRAACLTGAARRSRVKTVAERTTAGTPVDSRPARSDLRMREAFRARTPLANMV